ncbi:agmatine deiminase family protein, partial [Flavobacteriales bacterium]|nr:agmatine deiminase family protein [Flavobacteriales bacterium]
PIPNYTVKGKRLPATYTNFLITNNKVLVPVYNKPEDAFAIKQFKSCFNTREVVPINCEALISQGGSLHCVTMQIPKGFLNLALL